MQRDTTARSTGRGGLALAIGIGAMVVAFAASGDVGAQPHGHSIYMTAVEFKGSTTSDKLGPPAVDPSKLSYGYVYRAPGQAERSAPQRWEVASYQFSPSFVTAYQDDSIMLSVFIANGDHHEVRLTDPDGQVVLEKASWDQGPRVYEVFSGREGGRLSPRMRKPQAVDDSDRHGPAALEERR